MMKIWNKNTGLCPSIFFFKVNNMKYWHPHLPLGQHISVSTLVSVAKKIYMSLLTLSVLFFSSTVCIIAMTSYLIVTKMLMPALYCTKTFFSSFLTLFGHIILTTRLCCSSLIIIAYINNKYQVWSDLGIKTMIFHTKCDHRNPTVVHIKKLFPHNFIFLIHVWQKGNVKSSDKW